jgi:hypothetical protein
MLTFDECKKIAPDLNNLSDKELEELRGAIYAIARKVLDNYFKDLE